MAFNSQDKDVMKSTIHHAPHHTLLVFTIYCLLAFNWILVWVSGLFQMAKCILFIQCDEKNCKEILQVTVNKIHCIPYHGKLRIPIASSTTQLEQLYAEKGNA